MITLHHLENSRSQRVLWLLEELGMDYEVKRYERDKVTSLAPKELMAVHPLGKSPVIDDDGVVYAETGAIIDHLVEAYGGGALIPPAGSPERRQYKYWLYAAEGSYMPPLVMELFLGRMETAKMPFFAKPIARKLTGAVRAGYLTHTTEALFNHLDAELGRSEWLAGAEFSAADIIMSFPIEAALQRIDTAGRLKSLMPFVEKIHARPGYQRALARGGPYAYA